VREPQITITCDCGAIGRVRLGERWVCEECGRAWDTAQIPREDVDAVYRSVRRYRLLAVGPPVALAAVLIPLAAFVGLRFAYLLFVLLLAHALFVMPKLRRRATEQVRSDTPRWELRPEEPTVS
jgi:hypothetical protein